MKTKAVIKATVLAGGIALAMFPARAGDRVVPDEPLDVAELVQRFVLVMPIPALTTAEKLTLIGFRAGLSGLCGLPATFAGMPNPPDRAESAAFSAGFLFAGEFLDGHEGCESWQSRQMRTRLGVWVRKVGLE